MFHEHPKYKDYKFKSTQIKNPQTREKTSLCAQYEAQAQNMYLFVHIDEQRANDCGDFYRCEEL